MMNFKAMRGFALGLGAVLCAAPILHAQEIESLAISPDGSTLLISGDNRVVYRMDTAEMKVTERRYLPELVEWIAFSGDGNTVFMRTQEGNFRAVTAGSFKEKFVAEGVKAASYSASARRVALLEDSYKGGMLTVLAATSGKQISQVELPELPMREVAISDDGARAIVLTASASSDSEPKEQPASEVKGYDRYLFRQQNDGYTSNVVSVDLRARSFDVAETFFRVTSPDYVRMLGDKAAFVNGVGDSALVQADGQTQLINLGDKFVGHARISNDGSQVILTTNRDVRFHPISNGVTAEPTKEIKGDDIGGPSEGISAIAEAADGTIYLGTNAYRIWKVLPGSEEIVAAPVY